MGLNIKAPSEIEKRIWKLIDRTGLGNRLDRYFRNRYEGAVIGSTARGWVPQFLMDARFDADSMTRTELARKMRYFSSNSWLPQKISEVFTKYTVGPNGLPVIPASSDHDWNARMHDHYTAWCEDPTRDSSLPMATCHKLLARDFDLHGENFILKTYRRGPKGSEPAIQLVEGHRVSTPGMEYAFGGMGVGMIDEGPGIVDGVSVDAWGKPQGYHIRDGFEGADWRFKPASSVIHIFDPQRIGMKRGISPYYAVLNSLQDLFELEIFEMLRAKDNSQNSNFWETWDGEFDQAALRQNRFQQGNQAGVTNEKAFQERLSFFRSIFGSRSIALKPGEKVTQQGNVNPSAATQWYWRYKISQICSARGIPMTLVMPESLQGTVTRGVLDDANQYFRGMSYLFGRGAREIYQHFADWARYNIADLADAPHDWKRCHVIPPRAVNVDVGRNSAAQLAELAAGIITFDDIAAANGTTPEVLFRSKARSIGRIKQIAAEESKRMGVSIDPAEISGPIADVLAKLATANAAADLAEKRKQEEEETELVTE